MRVFGVDIRPHRVKLQAQRHNLRPEDAGSAITGTCPRRFSSSAIAISGLMSPNVPMFDRTMRKRPVTSVPSRNHRNIVLRGSSGWPSV
jgi:hypothetical protein